jgi:CYTH domain-containing protein
MGTEIERKFLPNGDGWKSVADGPGQVIRQGYLSNSRERTVRVRIKGERAWITVKGINVGASRPEFEYPIPPEDAAWMLDHLCEKPQIDKTRHVVRQNGCAFEIDEFHGENAGLVIVEVELEGEDQEVDLPEWVGAEVTGDARYYNSNIARNPGAWRQWRGE